MQKYKPDSRLDGITRIPTRFDQRKMLPDTGTAAEFGWSKIPTIPMYRKPMAKRIFAIYFLSSTIGFATAWFGAATFDHINLKIDSFRDRLDIVPYK
uniref:Deltameth_res domain-containing protein n=2 Tax=Caenorhabditis tropicalis TaxID=1561998 RepID=A0A1I7UVY1_9PELO